MRTLLLLTVLMAACAPEATDEAGPELQSIKVGVGEYEPQAGAASVDVGVNEEALVACNDTNYCSALKLAIKAELNYRCGSGWSTPSGSCTASTWTVTAPGGRNATAGRVSSTQRYVSASQCTSFTQTCSCSNGNVVCD